MASIRAVLLDADGVIQLPRPTWRASLQALYLRKWRSNVPVEDALRTWTQIEPAADILALVRALRCSGVTVSLATNQQAYRANFMTSTLGYAEHFDHLLYSCELGHSKPSAEYFSSALARVMIDPAQVLTMAMQRTPESFTRMASEIGRHWCGR